MLSRNYIRNLGQVIYINQVDLKEPDIAMKSWPGVLHQAFICDVTTLQLDIIAVQVYGVPIFQLDIVPTHFTPRLSIYLFVQAKLL